MIDAFSDELDEGDAELLCALSELARANMTEMVERFVQALNADLILPSDF